MGLLLPREVHSGLVSLRSMPSTWSAPPRRSQKPNWRTWRSSSCAYTATGSVSMSSSPISGVSLASASASSSSSRDTPCRKGCDCRLGLPAPPPRSKLRRPSGRWYVMKYTSAWAGSSV
eukprot:scaffold3768_cov376-Prasinococcus_capsulatus_cf.AAC.16